MLLKIMTILVMTIPSLSISAIDLDNSDFEGWRYELDGCQKGICEGYSAGEAMLMQNYGLALSEHHPNDVFYRIKPSNKGKGLRELAGGISTATGKSIDAVQNVIEGMRQTAVDAGFDTFSGTLAGEGISVSFSYNFKSGAWSFTAKGSGSPLDDEKKTIDIPVTGN